MKKIYLLLAALGFFSLQSSRNVEKPVAEDKTQQQENIDTQESQEGFPIFLFIISQRYGLLRMGMISSGKITKGMY